MADELVDTGKPLAKCTKAELIDIVMYLEAELKAIKTPEAIRAMEVGSAVIRRQEDQMRVYRVRMPWWEMLGLVRY